MTIRTTYYVEYGSGSDYATLEAKSSFAKESQFNNHLAAVKDTVEHSPSGGYTWYKAHYVVYEHGKNAAFVEVANYVKVVKPSRELNHTI